MDFAFVYFEACEIAEFAAAEEIEVYEADASDGY